MASRANLTHSFLLIPAKVIDPNCRSGTLAARARALPLPRRLVIFEAMRCPVAAKPCLGLERRICARDDTVLFVVESPRKINSLDCEFGRSVGLDCDEFKAASPSSSARCHIIFDFRAI